MSLLGNSLDLPFEEGPLTEMLDVAQSLVCGGVVVLAAAVPVTDVGTVPGLVFRFAIPTGQFYKPLLLVLDEDQAAKLPELITKAVQAAIRTAAAGEVHGG